MLSTTASIQPLLRNMAACLYHPSDYRLIASCLLGGLGLLLSGCTDAILPTQYKTYLADPVNGLTQTTETKGATITCSYRPTDLLILQDLAGVPTATPAAHDSLARAYAGKTYCTLTLARNGSEIENQFINDPTTYQQALAYLNTGIAADTFLSTTPHDSVAASASMYVRQYGTTGHSTLLLVFDTHRLHLEEGFHLTLQGQRLGLGAIRFAFTKRNLAAVPSLKLN